MRRDLALVLAGLLVRLLVAAGLGLLRLFGPPLGPDLQAELMLTAQIVALATASVVGVGLARLSRHPEAPRITRVALYAWLVGVALEILRLGWSVALAWQGAPPSWSPGGTGIAAALVELTALVLLLPCVGRFVSTAAVEPWTRVRRGLTAFRRALGWHLTLILVGHLAIIATAAVHHAPLLRVVTLAMGLAFSTTTTVMALGTADLLAAPTRTRALTAVGLVLMVLAALSEMGNLAVALQDPRPFDNDGAMARATFLGGVAHLGGLLALLALLGTFKGLAPDGAVRSGLVGSLVGLLFVTEAALRLLLVTRVRVSGAWIIALGAAAFALALVVLLLCSRLLRRLAAQLTPA